MHFSPAPMHIPDGFLSVIVSVFFWIISALVVAVALKRVSADLGERQAPLMGVLAAAIFAGQMLSFAVAGGTSGHLMGAALATILIGPWAAILVMTTVVSVQALIFQDGGLLVLGANIFNMGILGVAVSFAAYSTIQRLAAGKRWGIFAGGFTAAWLSVFIASLCVALQLALSGTSPANLAVPAMAAIHAVIGLGEGLITVGALAMVLAARPDLLKPAGASAQGGKLVWIFGLLIALLLVVLSPLASAHPDGLMRVATQQGFLASAKNPLYQVIPGYILPGISNQTLASVLAGIIGVLIVFAVALMVAVNRRARHTPD